jgi:Major Facilitator Superfamily
MILGALMLGMLLAALGQTILATALPTIAGDLHGLNHLSYVVAAYLPTSTISMPLWGKLGDMYGRKTLLQAAIAIFLIGSALAGLSQDLGQLIGFRALQGSAGRADGRRAGDHRRCRQPAAARPLHGLLRRGVRPAQRHRAAGRRVHYPARELALGVLQQPADRRGRACRHRARPAPAGQAHGPRDRLSGNRPAGRGHHRGDPADYLGRHDLPWARRRSSALRPLPWC